MTESDDMFTVEDLEEEEEKKSSPISELQIAEESDDIFSINDLEEEEETVSEVTEVTEDASDDIFTMSDLDVEEPESTTSQTKEAFQLDEDYAMETRDDMAVKTLDQFATDDNFLSTLRSYADKRFGESGKQEEGETDKEYVKRFITHYRQINSNTLDLMGQVDWVRNASESDKEEFGALYRDIQRLPDFYEEGGTGTLDAFVDYGLSIISDPINLIGLGTAKVASVGAMQLAKKSLLETGKQATKKEALKIGLKAAKVPLAIETTAEAIRGGYDVQALSEVESAAELADEEGNLKDEATLGEILRGSAINVGIVGGIGASTVKMLGKDAIASARKQLIKEGKSDKLAAQLMSGKQTVDKNVGRQITMNLDDTSFDPIEGRTILDNLDPDLDVSNLDLLTKNVKVDVIKRVSKIATEVVEDMLIDPQGRYNTFLKAYQDGDKKASEAIGEILKGFGNKEFKGMDLDILDGAIARAGLSQEQFAKVTFSSFSEAGSLLQASSPLGKLLKGYKDADPVIKKLYDEQMIGADNAPLSSFMEFMQRLDRERRALMVTQLATTVRNVATSGVRVGFEGAYNLIESSIYHAGRAVNSLATGTASVEGVKSGFRDIARDSFGQVAFLLDNNKAGELTDALLRYNPQLLRSLNRTTGEVGGSQALSRMTRTLNGFNMAQDAFMRRGVFTASVDKRLRRMGLSLADVHRQGKVLPPKLLKDSVEDALAFTFSRMPDANSKKFVGDGVAHAFITFNEKLGPLPSLIGAPVGTGAFPFARFMANAMQFQFQYSPVSFVGATFNSLGGLGKYLKGDAKAGELAMGKARKQMSQGLVGYAALMAAINHREKNQDVRWYEAKTTDARTADLRPFFPLAPYLIVADLIVKWDRNELDKIDMKTVFEGITGAQFRTGASSFMVDSLFKTIRSPSGFTDITGEKMAEYVGGYIGELVGGAMAPGRVVRDVVAAFDKEEAVIRDTKQLKGKGAVERGLSSAENSILRNLPFVQKTFPELESATREGRIYKQSPLGAQLTGVRKEERRTPIETELIKYGFENYKIVPSSGDREADSYVKKYMGVFVQDEIAKILEQDYYKNASETEKKVILKNNLNRFKSIAKRIGKAEADTEAYEQGKGFTPFDRAEFLRMPSASRKLANEYFLEKYGKSVMEMQNEEPKVNHLRFAKRIGQSLARIR